MNTFNRRFALSAALGAAALALAGCGSMYTMTSDVMSFGDWPADRAAGSYAFERLPSQQKSTRQAELEDAARAAMEKAGFKPAADAKSADVIVAIGARTTLTEFSPWDDPLWRNWRTNWRWGPGPRLFGHPFNTLDRRYEREVALLLRDRASGEAIYEARASSDGISEGSPQMLSGMFQAAMSDFPKSRDKPHGVSVTVQR